MTTIYERLGVRTFINARGTITTLGGSIMPPDVVEAMAQASRHFVQLDDFQQKADARLRELTGAPGAFICAGAASGMLLSGAACLTGTDPDAISRLPVVEDRPNQFVISLVDAHYYVHQGFEVCGGELVRVGSRQSVTPDDYANAITDCTAAVVYFLGTQPDDELGTIIEIAHTHSVPVIVDAAAQLPPRSNLTDLATKVGADLVVFSGGKGLFGPQSSGLILGRADLVEAARLNSSPFSGIGRGMKVGKEEIAGLLRAVERFFEEDEEALIAEWVRRCHVIGAVAEDVAGLEAVYHAPFTNRFPPASPLIDLQFADSSPLTAGQVRKQLEDGEPSILASGGDSTVRVGPQTLQAGEAEIIATRLRTILGV
ncbi:MAG: aminotransferase class V-fold PLP-dependent enzyme [Gemmatimonadetes bacterium]|jgi:D-glucosaminate-6-phosphate ammonia-lyase|nr:aminotransferase class V-fold PLP-dependent enzyme [Gemmatimonadota bacterium]MBT6150140.1 aminotransferase class V-fold PLP-dependent enzyme [Gemmatimonadota bacterium]MBT7860061.1 aminotransferase class V-fold PLP-dependent enzyme [Gemmatimonadota bacterium]